MARRQQKPDDPAPKSGDEDPTESAEAEDEGGEPEPVVAAKVATNGNGAAVHERPRTRPRQAPPARQRVKQGRRRPAKPEPEPIETVAEEPAADLEEEGPSPLEDTARSPELFVQRVVAHGPPDYPEGDTNEGPLKGGIPHRWDYEQAIFRRAGGGEYDVSGIIKGKKKTIRVRLGGPSRPLNGEENLVDDRDPSPLDMREIRMLRGGGGYDPRLDPGSPYYDPRLDPRNYQGPPVGPGFDRYERGPGFGRSAEARPGADLGVQQHTVAAFQGSGVLTGEAQLRAESAALRTEIEEAKDRERVALEKAAIAEIERKADARVAELKAATDKALAELQSNRGAAGSDEWRQRIEEERLAQERRIAEEREERAERRAAEEKKQTEERERYDRERRERLEREDKEWRERVKREEAEERARREDRERQEKNADRLMTMFTAGQMKPNDMLGMMVKMKELGGGDDLKKFAGMAQSFEALKDAFGGGEGGGVEGKAERLVGAIGEAVTPALGEIGKIMAERTKLQLEKEQRQNPQQPQQQQQGWPQQQQPQVFYSQVPGMPGYAYPYVMGPNGVPVPAFQQPQQPQQIPMTPQQQQVQNGAARVQSEAGTVTPMQWGKILEHVVDAAIGNAEPPATAQHLLTTLKAIDALPALDQLVAAKVPVLKGKVNLLIYSGKVTDPHYLGKMQTFVKIASDPAGVRWLEAVLEELRLIYEEIRKLAAAKQAAAQQPKPHQAQTQQQRRAQPRNAPVPPPVEQAEEGEDEGDFEDEDFEEGDEGDGDEPELPDGGQAGPGPPPGVVLS